LLTPLTGCPVWKPSPAPPQEGVPIVDRLPVIDLAAVAHAKDEDNELVVVDLVLVVEFFDDTGSCTYREPGQWSFAWVLDGRVIQDVLTYSLHANTGPTHGIGTSLRFSTGALGNGR